jgi:excisionase family DNA binding protein
MTDEHPQIMSSEQVAEMLGMTVQMVRLAARSGNLPAYRLPGGRAYKFFRDEIIEWAQPQGKAVIEVDM